jgi:hypothetical protein
MNRIQFFVLTGLSSIAALLFIGHIALTTKVGEAQNQLAIAQQVVQQGNIFQSDLKQLAVRIYSDSTHTGDPGLKGLLDRQHITYTPPATNTTETPATPANH